MGRDIVVWIPIRASKKITEEYQDAYTKKLELNFKTGVLPKDAKSGDKCYFAWNFLIHGYHEILGFEEKPDGFICETTGKQWSPGKYIVRDGSTLTWLLKAIPCKRFRGVAYLENVIER